MHRGLFITSLQEALNGKLFSKCWVEGTFVQKVHGRHFKILARSARTCLYLQRFLQSPRGSACIFKGLKRDALKSIRGQVYFVCILYCDMMGSHHGLPSSHPIRWSCLSHYLPEQWKEGSPQGRCSMGTRSGRWPIFSACTLHPWVGSRIRNIECKENRP